MRATSPQQQGRRQKRNSVSLKVTTSPYCQLIIVFMKWINLKSNNLPIVALEIERAIEVFTSLLDKTDSQSSLELVPEAAQLLEDLQVRIRQLDQYYRQHSLDQNISIFHMLKLKLQRTVYLATRLQPKHMKQSTKQITHHHSQTFLEGGDVRWLDQPLFTYYEQSPKKKDSKSSMMSFSHASEQKNSQLTKLPTKTEKARLGSKQFPPKSNLKTGKSNAALKKQLSIRSGKGEVTKVRPSKGGGLQGLQTPAFGEQRGLSPSSLLQQMKNESELKFTIKMTKEEYKDLLELKKKMNKSPGL